MSAALSPRSVGDELRSAWSPGRETNTSEWISEGKRPHPLHVLSHCSLHMFIAMKDENCSAETLDERSHKVLNTFVSHCGLFTTSLNTQSSSLRTQYVNSGQMSAGRGHHGTKYKCQSLVYMYLLHISCGCVQHSKIHHMFTMRSTAGNSK